jgi:hypothetical protein
MSILDDFGDCLNSTATITGRTQSYNDTTSEYEYNTTAKASDVICSYYEGSSALAFVGEKYRAKVDGVFIFNPNDLAGVTVADSDTISLTGGGTFQVIHSDDIMQLGEVYSVAVQEVK